MRTHHSQHRSKIRYAAYLVILVTALVVVTPVLADYIGPSNRTVTESGSCNIDLIQCMYVPAKGDYRERTVNSWSCSNESKPWQSYPSQPPSSGCFDKTAGYKYWEKDENTHEVTYPPATVQGILQNCTLSNGWCTTAPQLSLTGTEPIPGYNILAIEGTRNGVEFACTGPGCNVPLLEGPNNFTYWAFSSWADTSLMGTLNAWVDTVKPAISGTLTSTVGSNGWYTSPVTFNGSAADATSGLAAFTCTLDGAPLSSCSSITINGEGAHTLVLTALDHAGQTANLTQNTSIDTQHPTLKVSLDGTSGSNPNWYTSAGLNGSASDASPGSGLSAFEYRLDENGWTAFPVSGELSLPDGVHTVHLRATDNAGLTVSSLKEYSLDSVPPAIAILPAGTSGTDNWFTTNLQLSASVSDETSGIKGFEYSLDNDPWIPYTSQLVLTDGIHDISFWAQDEAGLESQVNKTYLVDTHVPGIGGSFSGIPGQNGWFTTNVTVSASAFDPQPGSGIDTFTYSLDGSQEDSFTSPLVLSDGQHTLQLNAWDKAGLSYTTEQTVYVDTIQPTLDIQTVLPGWVKESVTLEGTASDSGSGLSKVEISTDGGKTWQTLSDAASWSYRWDTSKNSNGPDEVVVQVTDRAGLSGRQSLNTGVDNSAPIISLPASWYQWDTINLDIQEQHSGLSEAYLEISDPQKRWPARIIQLNAATFPMSFKWDRCFADGTTAPGGLYDVKVVAVDNLGNSAIETASVRIVINLPPGPTATFIPTSLPTATPTVSVAATATAANTATQAVVITGFGSTLEPNVTATPKAAITSTPRPVPTQNKVVEWFESRFPSYSDATPGTTEISSPVGIGLTSPVTDSGSNVLWGATAAAVMGSLTAFALEEKRKQLEQAHAAIEEKERRKRIKNKKMAKLEAQWAQERAWEAERELEKQQEILYQAHMESRVLGREIEAEAKRVAEEKAERERKEASKREEEVAEKYRAAMAAYSAGRQKEVKDVVTPEKTTSKWEKVWSWVDEHQTELALGVGVAVGVAAIVLSGGIAAPLVAAAWVAGAAAVAAGTVAVGTVALNAHYEREWNTNLLKNVALAGVAAAVVSGGWFLLHGAMTGVGAFCATNQARCAQVEPVFNAIDTGEQLSLQGKLAYQTWRGDVEGASQTALELQMEYLDGNMPGNSIADDLGFDTIAEVARYGDDAVDLVKLYGVDAANIILQYQKEGIVLLQKHGLDAINLIQRFPDKAVDVLKVIDPKSAETLLTSLDDDVLDYALEQSPEAVKALAGWSTKDLRLHGSELALRAENDANALANVRKLLDTKPIDPKNLTDEQKSLVEAIAKYSTQYSDNGQVVLGKWVDYGGGFVEAARDTGSVHYNPHPDMWNMFGELEEKRDEVAWLVNQQVVQTGMSKNLPFEYSLNGIPVEKIKREQQAIEALFSGATDSEIIDILKTDYLPVRIKELQELHKAGYQFTFDEITNSFLLVQP